MLKIEILTQKEVAERMRCSSKYVASLRQAGLLPATRYGRRWLYKESDINEFIEKSIETGNDYSKIRIGAQGSSQNSPKVL